MHWIVPALAAPFLSAVVNFIDKYLVSGRVRNYRAMPVYSAVVNFSLGTLVWVLIGFPGFLANELFFAILSGFLLALTTAVYYFLLFRGDTSDVIFLFSLNPVFVLAMSYLILGQRIAPSQYLGFFLVLLAVILISWGGVPRRLFSAAILGPAIIMDLLMAGSITCINLAINKATFFEVITCQGWGMGLGGLVLLLFIPQVRRAVSENMETVRLCVFSTVVLNESLTVFAEWIIFFAYSIGPAALISVVGGTQAFYAIILGVVLTLAFPAVFGEDTSKGSLVRRLLAAVILIAGLYFVYV